MNYVFFSHVATNDNDRNIFCLSRSLAAFQAINRSMTVEAANVFLMVSLNEGLKSVEYMRLCGLAQSTLSRYLIDLSEYRRDLSEDTSTGRKEGYGLVRSEVDPMELRAKRYWLTPKGHALRDRLAGIASGASPAGPTKSVVAAPKKH